MAVSRVTATLRGLLVPDERLSVANLTANTGAAGTSSYTQAGPRPGSAVPSDAKSQLVIQASGEQDVELEVKVLGAGHPLAPRGLRVGYKPTSEGASSQTRGWNGQNLVELWHAAVYVPAATMSYKCLDVSAIPSSQKVLVSYMEDTAGADLIFGIYDPEADTFTLTTFAGGFDFVASHCYLPNGRLLALAEGSSTALTGTITGYHVYRSDDDGVTWALHGLNVLETPPSGTSANRSRLRYLPNGDMLFFCVETGPAAAYWYASSSVGATFSLIATWSHGALAPAIPDVVILPSGRIGVVSCDGTGHPTWQSVGSVYDDVSLASATTIDGTQTLNEVSAVVDESGRVLVYGRGTAASGSVYVWYSDDEGTTWVQYSYGAYASGDGSTYPTLGAFVAARGAIWWLHQWGASPATTDNSVALMRLGGWSNATVIEDAASGKTDFDARRIAFGASSLAGTSNIVWTPFDKPSNVTGWTDDGGAGTETLVIGGVQYVTAAQTKSAQVTTVGTGNVSLNLIEGTCDSGGSVGSTQAGFTGRVSDGVTAYQYEVNCTTTQFRVRDTVAGTTLTTVTFDMTSKTQFLIRHYGAALFIGYRRPGAVKWTTAYDSTASGNLTGTASATSHFKFGNVAVGTATSTWRLVAHASGWSAGSLGLQTLLSSTEVAGVVGRPCTALPVGLWEKATAGATFVRGVDGPGYTGETHTITPAYDYPVTALHHAASPSPAVRHRTTGQTEAIVAWTPDSDNKTTLGSRSVAMALLGVNYRTAYLEGWDGAAWTTLATYDGSADFTTAKYTLTGDCVRVDNTTTALTRYIHEAELIGAHLDMGGGVHRKIVRHESGVWDTSSSKQAELIISISGGEPASGTGVIYHHSGVVVAHNISTRYSRFRLRIPAQTTAEGYFETGLCLIGAFRPFAKQWSRGRADAYGPNAQTTKDAAGVSRVRSLGAPLRRWTLPWSDGMDLSPVSGTPSPNYLAADTGAALANRGETPWTLAGLMTTLDSGRIPVVALAKVSNATGQTITDPSLYLYGRASKEISLESTLGNEGVSEFVRVPSLVIEGIP